VRDQSRFESTHRVEIALMATIVRILARESGDELASICNQSVCCLLMRFLLTVSSSPFAGILLVTMQTTMPNSRSLRGAKWANV
jgi:hypothetical protein